jgi:hypothetical protein
MAPRDLPYVSIPFVISETTAVGATPVSIDETVPHQMPGSTDMGTWLAEDRESVADIWGDIGISIAVQSNQWFPLFDHDLPIESLLGKRSDQSDLSLLPPSPPIPAPLGEGSGADGSADHPPYDRPTDVLVVTPTDDRGVPPLAHTPIPAPLKEDTSEGKALAQDMSALDTLRQYAVEQWMHAHRQGLPDRQLRAARMRILCGTAATAFFIETGEDLQEVFLRVNASDVDRQHPWLVPWLSQCFDMEQSKVLGYLNRWVRAIRSKQ